MFDGEIPSEKDEEGRVIIDRDGEMFGYVLNFLRYEPEHRVDPMAVVFPTMTKCTFRSYGQSGTIKTEDALCILPINIINQRLYVFFWFWLVILSTITAINYHFEFT